jgi:hypothetical protein
MVALILHCTHWLFKLAMHTDTLVPSAWGFVFELGFVYTLYRSMQELLVRFEPPDIFGVPPSPHVLQGVESTSESTFASVNVSSLPDSTSIQLASPTAGALEGAHFGATQDPFQSLPTFSKQ